MPAHFTPTARIRRSPFFDSTVADGVRSFTVYNHMYMPTGFGDPMGEYWRLITGVSMWDVACQRQVELAGPDAGRLAQILCPRKIENMKAGQGWYVPICDYNGVLLNDPVLLKLSPERYWLSIADGDLLLWVRAIASERSLEVTVTEPDVSPLAVQGPKAIDVMAGLIDDSVRQMGHFRFREIDLDGIPIVLQRSGWSRQGGFELYLRDGSRGAELWDMVKAAGGRHGIGPGCPNGMERIESGLLSFRGDTDDQTDPFEVRLGKYVDLDAPDDVIGIAALRRLREHGPQRHQLGVALDNDDQLGHFDRWSKVWMGSTMAGHMTTNAWSPRLEMNIGLCLIWTGVNPGDRVRVELPTGRQIEGEIRDLPFL